MNARRLGRQMRAIVSPCQHHAALPRFRAAWEASWAFELLPPCYLGRRARSDDARRYSSLIAAHARAQSGAAARRFGR